MKELKLRKGNKKSIRIEDIDLRKHLVRYYGTDGSCNDEYLTYNQKKGLFIFVSMSSGQQGAEHETMKDVFKVQMPKLKIYEL